MRRKRGGDVVLRRERVGRAQRDLGAARLEREHQVGGLGGDVEARADAHAGQRLGLREAVADLSEHGHERGGPLDARFAGVREGDVFHVAASLFDCLHGCCSSSFWMCEAKATVLVETSSNGATGPLSPRGVRSSCLVDRSVPGIDAYLDRLASAEPTPGGGSAATLVGAMGAALCAMVARITAGNDRYASVRDRGAGGRGGRRRAARAARGRPPPRRGGVRARRRRVRAAEGDRRAEARAHRGAASRPRRRGRGAARRGRAERRGRRARRARRTRSATRTS